MKNIITLIMAGILLFSSCGFQAADDTQALQSLFDGLNEGLGNWNPNYVELQPRVYIVNGELDVKHKYRAIVDCHGAVLSGNFTINASGSYMEFRNCNLHSTSDKPAFIYGRDSDGAGGWMVLDNVDVFSNNSIAAVLFAQADLSRIANSEIYNGGNAPALILTSENETGLLDYAASTATLMSIRDCYIHGNGDVLVSMRGLIQNVTFDTVFFMPNGAAVELTNGQAHAVSFPNSRSEGLADAVLLRTLPGTILEGLYYQGYIHAVINAGYVFDIQGAATNIEDTFISRSNSQTQNFKGTVSFIGDEKRLKKAVITTAPGSFAYADAEIIKLDHASLIWFAPLRDPQRVVIIFDGFSTLQGGYFKGIPDPYTPEAGTAREFISDGWYWTVIQ